MTRKKVLDRAEEVGYNIPQSLQICGELTPVTTRRDNDHDGTYDGEDMEVEGGGVINIDPRVHPSKVRRVLLHEAIHGIFRRTGLTELLDEKVEEMICSNLDMHLPAVLNEIWTEVEREKKPRPRTTRDKATLRGNTRKK